MLDGVILDHQSGHPNGRSRIEQTIFVSVIGHHRPYLAFARRSKKPTQNRVITPFVRYCSFLHYEKVVIVSLIYLRFLHKSTHVTRISFKTNNRFIQSSELSVITRFFFGFKCKPSDLIFVTSANFGQNAPLVPR